MSGVAVLGFSMSGVVVLGVWNVGLVPLPDAREARDVAASPSPSASLNSGVMVGSGGKVVTPGGMPAATDSSVRLIGVDSSRVAWLDAAVLGGIGCLLSITSFESLSPPTSLGSCPY